METFHWEAERYAIGNIDLTILMGSVKFSGKRLALYRHCKDKGQKFRTASKSLVGGIWRNALRTSSLSKGFSRTSY